MMGRTTVKTDYVSVEERKLHKRKNIAQNIYKYFGWIIKDKPQSVK